MVNSKLLLITTYYLASYQIAACPLRADALGAARPRATLASQVRYVPSQWLASRPCVVLALRPVPVACSPPLWLAPCPYGLLLSRSRSQSRS